MYEYETHSLWHNTNEPPIIEALMHIGVVDRTESWQSAAFESARISFGMVGITIAPKPFIPLLGEWKIFYYPL